MIQNRRDESGAAMFVAVLMLRLMGALGLAALEGATQDRQIAGFQNRSDNAFQAAEAAVAQARQIVRDDPTPGAVGKLAVTNLADAVLYDYETALPRYGPDPAMAGVNPTGILDLDKSGPAPGMNMSVGAAAITVSYWQINVEGRSPQAGIGLGARASTARIETIEAKVGSSGY